MASSAEDDISDKSKHWDDLRWWEKAKLSLAQAAVWLIVSAIVLFVVGNVLPRINLLAEMIGLAPNMFILCAALLASPLATWRSGKQATERVGPIFAVIALGAIIAQVNGWQPFSIERDGEYREIIDRQDKLIGLWQACVENDDEDSCSEAKSQHEQLDQLQRRREALLR